MLTDLNDECILGIEECLRLNASMVAVMVAIGSKFEALTIRNLTTIVDQGSRYGIPMLGVTAVGKELVRDARYLSLGHAGLCRERRARHQDVLLRRPTSRRSRPPARCRS